MQAGIHHQNDPDAVKKLWLRDQAMKKYDESIPQFQKVEADLATKGKLLDDKTALRNAWYFGNDLRTKETKINLTRTHSSTTILIKIIKRKILLSKPCNVQGFVF